MPLRIIGVALVAALLAAWSNSNNGTGPTQIDSTMSFFVTSG